MELLFLRVQELRRVFFARLLTSPRRVQLCVGGAGFGSQLVRS